MGLNIETITIDKKHALNITLLLNDLIDEGTYLKPEEKEAVKVLRSKIV